MARLARKQLADLRALEEQTERQNIIDPREVTTEELLGGKHRLSNQLLTPMEGYGRAGDGEAAALGMKLGKYLMDKHGARYHRAFVGGCGGYGGGCGMSGGALGNDETSGNVSFSGSYRGLGAKHESESESDEEMNGNGATPSMGLSQVRGGVITTKAIPSYTGPSALRFLKGQCSQQISRAEAAEKSGGQRMVGGHCPSLSHTRETVDGSGRVKKRRAPASASDGRRKRAEIVKRVMREQGLKMIEASKYVKEHGLY